MARERIIVTLQGDETDDHPARTAAHLSARFDATLDAVFLEPDPSDLLMWSGPSGASGAVLAGAMTTIQQDSDQAAERAKQSFINGLESAELTAARGRFLRISDKPAEAAAETRLSRVVVTSREAARGEGLNGDMVTAILIDEHVPIYVPGRSELPPQIVAIAWDGSREAGRSIYAASPLISSAERVIILQSEKGIEYHDRRAASIDRLYDWLSVRGKQARTVDLDAMEGPLGMRILEAANDADLLVSGAYGHSRLREFVFGGVTRTLLSAADGPAMLLQH